MRFAEKRPGSAGTLVVGDALGLGSHAVLGGEGQNDHGCHEGHHVVDVAGPVELCAAGGVGDVGQTLEHLSLIQI